MHKLAVDVIFTQITSNKGVKIYVDRAVAAMYKYYTKFQYMRVMGSLEPDNLTRSQKGSTAGNKPNKRKMGRKTKSKEMCRWTASEMLHA